MKNNLFAFGFGSLARVVYRSKRCLLIWDVFTGEQRQTCMEDKKDGQGRR